MIDNADYDFSQVDVFGASSFRGNPLAVVHNADGLTTDQMQEFARWTNLSETTFLMAPTTPEADYRVRIFTGSGELPFAGHPTLGSCYAWLTRNAEVAKDVIIQECGAGLVPVRRLHDQQLESSGGAKLAFAAPPLIDFSPLEAAELQTVAAELGISPDRIEMARHIDNGPGWIGVLLSDADEVLSLPAAGLRTPVGVIGPCPPDSPYDIEVRGFFPSGDVVFEDPVTGSLNAAIAQWLVPLGILPKTYLAHQGTLVGADGVISIDQDDDGTVWVAGNCATKITGRVDFGA
jgi:PhzF family phenazine biosynthesis protein